MISSLSSHMVFAPILSSSPPSYSLASFGCSLTAWTSLRLWSIRFCASVGFCARWTNQTWWLFQSFPLLSHVVLLTNLTSFLPFVFLSLSFFLSPHTYHYLSLFPLVSSWWRSPCCFSVSHQNIFWMWYTVSYALSNLLPHRSYTREIPPHSLPEPSSHRSSRYLQT